MTVLTVHTPAPVQVPRFAPLAATLFARLLQALEAGGRALAASHAAAERQRQARELRQFALQHAGHDPRFAADLMAAADRHERCA
jgi:hypothetical protein